MDRTSTKENGDDAVAVKRQEMNPYLLRGKKAEQLHQREIGNGIGVEANDPAKSTVVGAILMILAIMVLLLPFSIRKFSHILARANKDIKDEE